MLERAVPGGAVHHPRQQLAGLIADRGMPKTTVSCTLRDSVTMTPADAGCLMPESGWSGLGGPADRTCPAAFTWMACDVAWLD
jgi:hypothetical protein